MTRFNSFAERDVWLRAWRMGFARTAVRSFTGLTRFADHAVVAHRRGEAYEQELDAAGAITVVVAGREMFRRWCTGNPGRLGARRGDDFQNAVRVFNPDDMDKVRERTVGEVVWIESWKLGDSAKAELGNKIAVYNASKKLGAG